MKKKNIAIVTGGGGFIGSHIVDLLLKKKFYVLVIDNFSGGRIENLKQHKNKVLEADKILRKFPLNQNLFISSKQETPVTDIGVLINGVQIRSPISDDQISITPKFEWPNSYWFIAERTNGRLAMIGFMAVIINYTLFGWIAYPFL